MAGDPGAYGAGDTLVPISNTKVKTRCGDDTRKGKVARCRIDQKPAERQVFGVFGIDTRVWRSVLERIPLALRFEPLVVAEGLGEGLERASEA
jgi:hypothetical protein